MTIKPSKSETHMNTAGVVYPTHPVSQSLATLELEIMRLYGNCVAASLVGAASLEVEAYPLPKNP